MAELLKLQYSNALITEFANKIKEECPAFNQNEFEKAVLDNDWKEKELKARTTHIANNFAAFLPFNYPKQAQILAAASRHFNGFTATVFPTFVEIYGLDDYETSIAALEEMTQYSTAEFAIRPFIVKYPKTMQQLRQWSMHPNYHVRRLASEGCRPLLPWAMKLTDFVKDPSAIIPILTNLKNDPEDYVYRSVANNLNDISKHHPDLVLNLCKEWINESDTTTWVCKHALRTLLKKGNQKAMRLFGFGKIDAIKVNTFKLDSNTIPLGGFTTFLLDVINTGKKGLFRLEYSIEYLKKNGTHNEKVFQIKEAEIQPNESINLEKKLIFKELTTRKHYPGKHFINLKINGIKNRAANV